MSSRPSSMESSRSLRVRAVHRLGEEDEEAEERCKYVNVHAQTLANCADRFAVVWIGEMQDASTAPLTGDVAHEDVAQFIHYMPSLSTTWTAYSRTPPRIATLQCHTQAVHPSSALNGPQPPRLFVRAATWEWQRTPRNHPPSLVSDASGARRLWIPPCVPEKPYQASC